MSLTHVAKNTPPRWHTEHGALTPWTDIETADGRLIQFWACSCGLKTFVEYGKRLRWAPCEQCRALKAKDPCTQCEMAA